MLKTAGGQAVRLLGNVRHIWKDGDGAFCVFCLYLPWRLLVDSAKELHSSPKFADTRVGVASRCDHPDWGRECLRKFMVQAMLAVAGVLACRCLFDPNRGAT